VNTDLERPVIAQIIVRGARVSSSAQVDRVTADSLDAVTSYQRPDAVKLTHESIRAANGFSLELPKHSVSVVTLALAK
jgi:alpha-L-arabinofuranosidase